MSMSEVIRGTLLPYETKFRNMLILSAVFHFVTLTLLILLPGLQFGPRINLLPQYTPVRLVNLNDLPGTKSPSTIKQVEKAKQKVVAQEPTRIEKKLEVKKLEPSKIVPQKTVVPKTVPLAEKKPIKKEEPVQPQSPPQQGETHLRQAISRIRENLGKGAQATTAGGVGVKGGVGTEAIPEIVVYTSIVIDRIMEAWFLPPSLKQEAFARNLLTIIDIRIDREGKVFFQGIEQNSGHSLYDDYALAAIKKVQSESFPPLPDVFREPYLDLGIRFQSSEVNVT